MTIISCQKRKHYNAWKKITGKLSFLIHGCYPGNHGINNIIHLLTSQANVSCFLFTKIVSRIPQLYNTALLQGHYVGLFTFACRIWLAPPPHTVHTKSTQLSAAKIQGLIQKFLSKGWGGRKLVIYLS